MTNTDNTNKALSTAVIKYVEFDVGRVRGGCKKCGGIGYEIRLTAHISPKLNSAKGSHEPCPTCTPEVSRLNAIAKAWEWLTFDNLCLICGGSNRRLVGISNLGAIFAQDHSLKCDSPYHKKQLSPKIGDNSTHDLVKLLRDLKVWQGEDSFCDWLRNTSHPTNGYYKFANNLTDIKLFTQAITSYLLQLIKEGGK